MLMEGGADTGFGGTGLAVAHRHCAPAEPCAAALHLRCARATAAVHCVQPGAVREGSETQLKALLKHEEATDLVGELVNCGAHCAVSHLLHLRHRLLLHLQFGSAT